MVLETQWGESYLRVKNVTVSGDSATVQFQDTESSILYSRPYPVLYDGSPFHWEGSQAFVTQPGEWYLDNASGTVYYKPRAGEDLSSAAVTVPVAQTLLEVSGANLDNQVSNLSFSGITFTGTTWTRPTTSGYLNGQGGMYNLSADTSNNQYVGRPPAAVHVSDATNISFTGDTFTNLGATALDLDHGTHNSSAVGNVVNGVAGNGVMVGKFSDPTVEFHTLYNPPSSPSGEDVREVAMGNTVSNNLITRTGMDYYGTAGLNAGWVNSTTITHNEISDAPWAGISLGWGWQHNQGAAGNNTVDNNEISNVVNRLCDTAAIYHLSVDPGSTYDNNYLHDVQPTPASCPWSIAGVYLDEGSDQVSVQNNVISDVDEAVHLNITGPSNTIGNNTASGKAVIQAAGLESAYRSLRAKVDIAQGRPTTSSSRFARSDSAARAVDGDPSTGWASATRDTNPWWQVDLQSAQQLAQVQVVTRQDLDQPPTRTAFQVEVSNDPSFASYTTVGRITDTIPDAGSITFNVNNTGAYRYLRIQKFDGQSTFISSVRVTAGGGEVGVQPADPGIASGSYATITNVGSGMVIDVPASSTSDGTVLTQYGAKGSPNQQWQVNAVGGGLYRIINRNSGKAMDDFGGSRRKGSSVVQWTPGVGNNQLWYFEPAAGGAFVVRNFQSGQALEVSGGSTALGANLDQWTPLGAGNQLWTLTPTP